MYVTHVSGTSMEGLLGKGPPPKWPGKQFQLTNIHKSVYKLLINNTEVYF